MDRYVELVNRCRNALLYVEDYGEWRRALIQEVGDARRVWWAEKGATILIRFETKEH